MYGAIIGDLAGSIYEYDQFQKVGKIKMNKLIEENSFYSDDTILTIAILDAILNDRNYNKFLREYIKKYSKYKPNSKPYFDTIFSPNLIKWSEHNNQGNSHGNGAMMRISSIGYMFNNEQEIIDNVKKATIPSHNSKEAIESATKIALIIYYLRNKISLDTIYKKLNIKLKYEPITRFNYTCEETIDNCLYVLYNSKSFEDAIKKAVELGGDTDTNACIVGSMAEALYGINDELINKANDKIPEEFKKVLQKSNYR